MPSTLLPAVPSASEIRAALKHILISAAFSHSPMLAAFLKFVVETTLAGGGDRIKAYTIAVDGLGRGADFNPDTDAIVRVHAIRVRRALKRYYAVAGAEDTIIVDLPRRRYIPIFSRRLLPAAGMAVPLNILPRSLALRGGAVGLPQPSIRERLDRQTSQALPAPRSIADRFGTGDRSESNQLSADGGRSHRNTAVQIATLIRTSRLSRAQRIFQLAIELSRRAEWRNTPQYAAMSETAATHFERK